MALSKTMSVAGLTAEQRETFEREGYLVVPGALDPEQVEGLTESVDRVWETNREGPPVAGAEALHLLGFCGSDRRFLEMLDHAATLPLVVDLLGWNIFMYHCHLDVHPPVVGERPPVWMWHQDGGIQSRDIETDPRPRLSVKLAYFLTDLTEPGRGNFVVLPGSHLSNTLPRPAEGEPIVDPADATPVLAAPGDAVLFDRRLWHRRSDNRSALTRKAVFYGYTYRWIRVRDDVAVASELQDAITPVRSQLLGRGATSIGYWMPEEDDAPLAAWWAGRDAR
jgi:ectoine hydroxylase-related dioxygenase (phytanoyl-CoA dioxygenase family)